MTPEYEKQTRYCLNCKEKPATIPQYDPIFCSPSCAGKFARCDWFWCEKHNCWANVSFGCEQCNKQRQIEKLRRCQKDIEAEIQQLKKSEEQL